AFDGFGVLAAGLAALLPAALDAIVNALPGPRGALATAVLDLATALGVYDGVGGFAAHAGELRALSQPGWLTSPGLPRGTIAARIATVVARSPLAAIPNSAAAVTGEALTWTYTLAPGRTVSVTAGWQGGSPTAVLALGGIHLGAVEVPALRAG